jgi:hypothetical protein
MHTKEPYDIQFTRSTAKVETRKAGGTCGENRNVYRIWYEKPTEEYYFEDTGMKEV